MFAGQDRGKHVDAYLDEFCSLQAFPNIYTAIKNVLLCLPQKDFEKVCNEERAANAMVKRWGFTKEFQEPASR